PFAASCSAGETGVGDAAGGVRGDTARRATTRGFGLSFGFPATCVGAWTTMLGSAVVPFAAGAGVCDNAGLPRLQSRSEAAPEAANIGLVNTDFLPIPFRSPPQFVAVDEPGSACRRVGRNDFDGYRRDRPRMTRRSHRDLQSIDVRRSGEREAGNRCARSSDERIRRRWSGKEVQRPAAAAAPAALQITPRWRGTQRRTPR